MPKRKGQPPLCGVMRNPLVGVREHDLHHVAVGVPIASLAPAAKGQLFCRLNKQWLLRAWWASTLTKPGDVIEWFDLPPGGTPPA
jgi:hypothetical protein